jgi:hypothetical protein
VARLDKKNTVYLINVKEDERLQYEKLHKNCKCIAYGSLNSIKKHSFVIVEDIISMRTEDELKLRQALNYTAHHRASKIFCLTHTIFKTGLFSMLPLFHSIIFTCSPSNAPVVRQALSFFRLEKPTIARWIGQFKKWSKTLKASQKAYFFFDCNTMALCLSTDFLKRGSHKILGCLLDDDDNDDDDDDDDDEGDADDEKASRLGSKGTTGGLSRKLKPNSSHAHMATERMAKKFSEFFANHPFQSQALAIFSVMLERFGPTKIDPVDLTISFRSRHKGKTLKNLSTVDYVADLLSSHGRASQENRVLHNYVSKTCVIPKSCIRNQAFLPSPAT